MSQPDDADLAHILSLYDRDLHVQAYQAMRRHGDPLAWRSARACLLAARLVRNIGGRATAPLLFVRARRLDRRDPEVAYFWALHLLERRGPLAAWEACADFPVVDDGDAVARARFHLARAETLIVLRDFEAADGELRAAETLAPELAWVKLDRATWLERQDRRADALAVVNEARSDRPHYRPAVLLAAMLLARLGRGGDSLEILREATRHIESPDAWLLLAAHEEDLGQCAEARRSLLAAIAMMPAMDEPAFRSMCASFADSSYRAGDVDLAAGFARGSGRPFYRRFAERLEAGEPARRVELAVPFVPQDHRTCAPATLAMLSAYHGVPAEHVAIAEAICYDGTSAASERSWAEDNGFHVREHTVTWDSATRLLDEGIPFTLTTQHPPDAHLQAVSGYDARRRTFLVRDPSIPIMVEMDADEMLEGHAWCGPRGMALVPAARARRLAASDLPDSALHDRVHAVELGLRAHDREGARLKVEALVADAPDHPVSARAVHALAAYDANPFPQLRALERQIARHPGVAALRQARLSLLRGLTLAGERRAALEEANADESADPEIGRLLAEDLVSDARQHRRAERLVRRALRARPLSPKGYFTLATLYVAEHRWDEARQIFRFAACLDGAFEGAAGWYFTTCHQLRRTDEALRFLRTRFEQRGRRFAEPARTLSRCLHALGRTDEALDVLERALARRPGDGDLALEVVDALARAGQTERALALLGATSGKVREVDWLRTASALDVLAGDLPTARGRYQRILALEPLAFDVHAEKLGAVAALEGPSAAQRVAEELAARFPHNKEAAKLRIRWTDDEGEDTVAAALAYVAAAPEDAWGHRELVVRLAARQRFAEAEAALAEAVAREPRSAVTLAVTGWLEHVRGHDDRARAALESALRVDVDNVPALTLYTELGRTPAARQADLRFIGDELRRQGGGGAALVAFRGAAQGILPSDDILAVLEDLRRARPDVEEAWTAVASELLARGMTDEARALADEACGSFRLRPGVWLVLARVQRARDDRAAELAALGQAFRVAPDDARVVRALADCHLRDGNGQRARELLAAAVRRAPLDRTLHHALASAHVALGEHDQALARLEHALLLDSSYRLAWYDLARDAAIAGHKDRATAFARRLVAERPHSPWAHFGLAALLEGERDFDDKMAALDAAVREWPRFADAHDARAQLLASIGRFDDALAACAPAAYGEHPPTSLRGRVAWIGWQRGARDDAVAALQALVAEEPGYHFGWQCLGTWHAARDQDEAARAAYRRALELEPSLPVANRLLELDLAARDFDAVERTLAVLRREIGDAQARPGSLRLAVARGKLAGAVDLLIRMARDGAALGELHEATELIVSSGGGARVTSLLERLLDEPDVPASLGYLWAFFGRPRPTLAWWRCLARLRRRGAIGVEATKGYLERAARQHRILVPLYIAIHRRALASDASLWGTAGAVLLNIQRYRTAARWLASWRERAELEPWMLLNVVTALRAVGRDADAHQASLRALELPTGLGVSRHRLWLALDLALDLDRRPSAAGVLDEAHRVLAATNATEALDVFLRTATTGALAARDRNLPADVRGALVRGSLADCKNLIARYRLGRSSRRVVVRLAHLARAAAV